MLTAIKAEGAALDRSDEDLLEDLFASLPKLSWLVSPDIRRKGAVSIEQRMSAFSKLEEDSQEFLLTALILLETLPAELDHSTISISAWKTIENELNVKFLLPFRDWFVREHSDLKQTTLPDLDEKK